MLSAWNILNKIIVVPFYKRNGGWMLMLLLVMVGLVPNPILLHRQIMLFLSSSFVGVSVATIVWILYTLKCLFFQVKIFREKENALLFDLLCIDKRKLYSLFFSVQVILFLPVIIYGNLAAIVGLWHNNIICSIVLILIGSILFALLLKKIVDLLYKQNIKTNWIKVSSLLDIKKRFYSFGLSHLLIENPKHFFVAKCISLLILSIPLIRNAGTTELSDFMLFWSAAIGANIIIFHDLFLFYLEKLFILRNLPLQLWKIFMAHFLTICCIVLPEIILFAVYKDFLPNIHFAEIGFYTIGMAVLLHMLQWQKGTDLSTFLSYSAIILILQLFLAPYHIFLYLGLAFIVFSFLIFRSLYDRYEIEFKDAKETN